MGSMPGDLTFPVRTRLPRHEVEARFIRLQHRLVPDPGYHFSVMVTRDWKAVELNASPPTPESPIRLIAQLQRVAGPAAELNVTTALLPREVHPADWLELWLAGTRHRIVNGRRIPTRFGDVADFLCEEESGGEVVSRTIAIKDGNRLFALSGETTRADYAPLAEELLFAVQSFQLLSPTGEYFAEEMEIHTFEQPVRGALAFPASWTRTDDPTPPPGGISFTLLNRRQEGPAGHFTFAAIPHELERSANDFLLNYATQLRENGVTFERLGLTREREAGGAVKGAWSAILPGKREGKRLEVRCRVVETANAWVLLALAGPAREDDAQAYIINRRAFDIATAHLELSS